MTPGTSRKHADNCHRSHRGQEQQGAGAGGEQREHRHHRRRHHKHRQMSGGDHGEAGAELSVPVTSYQTVESGLHLLVIYQVSHFNHRPISGLYSVDVEYGYNYTRVGRTHTIPFLNWECQMKD